MIFIRNVVQFLYLNELQFVLENLVFFVSSGCFKIIIFIKSNHTITNFTKIIILLVISWIIFLFSFCFDQQIVYLVFAIVSPAFMQNMFDNCNFKFVFMFQKKLYVRLHQKCFSWFNFNSHLCKDAMLFSNHLDFLFLFSIVHWHPNVT